MQKAVTILKKFEYFHSDCQNYMAGKLVSKNLDESVIYSKLSEAKKNIHEALANDFSTPVVISELIDLAATVTKMLDSSQVVRKIFYSKIFQINYIHFFF